VNVLREYIRFFPESGLANVLQSYINSEISPFPPQEEENGNQKELTVTGPVNPSRAAPPCEILDAMIVYYFSPPYSLSWGTYMYTERT
jgi:superkiller protein 3